MKRLQLIAAVLVLTFSGSAVAQTSNGTGGGNGAPRRRGQEEMFRRVRNDHYSEHRLSLYRCSGDNHGDAEEFSGKIGVYDSSKVVFGNGGVYEHDINGGTLS